MFTSLAVVRYLQDITGLSLKKLVNLLKQLREVTISEGGHELIPELQIPDAIAEILQKLEMRGY